MAKITLNPSGNAVFTNPNFFFDNGIESWIDRYSLPARDSHGNENSSLVINPTGTSARLEFGWQPYAESAVSSSEYFPLFPSGDNVLVREVHLVTGVNLQGTGLNQQEFTSKSKIQTDTVCVEWSNDGGATFTQYQIMKFEAAAPMSQAKFYDSSWSVFLNGSDFITGSVGSDTIYGFKGNDTMDGDAGDDRLYGGFGNDTVNGGSGTDSILGEAGNDTLYGDAGNDEIAGGLGNDVIYGGLDNDTLAGNAGNDMLHGNSGNDLISGGYGNDQIYGDEGNDALAGGLGKDVLYGGTGDDMFVFDAPLESSNFDTVKDFSVSTEKIVLDHAVFSAFNTVEGLSAEDLVVVNSTAGVKASGHLTYCTANDTLYYDANGVGGGDLAVCKIELTGATAPTVDNFVVI